MNPVHVAPPAYAVTDGTYWPSGQGTIPLPVIFPDDGGTYVYIQISGAAGGDSLDTLFFNGVDLLANAVPMVGGDDNQSALDVLAEIEATTSNVFTGTVTGGTLVVYRDDGGSGVAGGGVQFTATTGAGTSISIVSARWVVEEAGSPGRYYLMDALDPGVNIVDISTFYSLVTGMWLYFPDAHELCKVTSLKVTGGGLLSADFGTHVLLNLDPVPTTAPATQYIVQLMPPQLAGVTVENIGGAPGEIDNATFIDGQVFDRSIRSRQLSRPLLYDSSGTMFAITLDSNT